MPKKEVHKHIAEIEKRLKEYHAHRNDAYAFDIEEIDQVRDFYTHAVRDVAFLLKKLAEKK